MTDEEIMELCRAECEAFRWPSSAIFIARAIEQKVREECAQMLDEEITMESSKETDIVLRFLSLRIRARGKE